MKVKNSYILCSYFPFCHDLIFILTPTW